MSLPLASAAADDAPRLAATLDPFAELAGHAELISGRPLEGIDARAKIIASLQLLRVRADAAERALHEHEDVQVRLESTIRALRATSRVLEGVASAFQRKRILRLITEALERTFGAAAARVWMVGPPDRCPTCPQATHCPTRTSCLHLVGSDELGPIDLALQRVPIGDWSVGRVAALGGLVATNELHKEPRLADPDWARVEGLTAFAGHPLVHEGRLLGVVAMWSRKLIRDEVLEALRILARQAATAIAGSELIDEVRDEGQKARSATRRLEALLESTRSGVIMFDTAGRITYANGSFRRLFGLHTAEEQPLIGMARDDLERALRPLLDEPQAEQPEPVLTNAEGPDTDRELQLRIPGLEKPRLLNRYRALVKDDSAKMVGWICVFDDVTQARELDRLKSEFISTVSHELRTPLTSIKGSLALLLDDEQLEPETMELLDVSKRNADRLVRLVNDILDMSKIEAGKLELLPQPLAPRAVCTDAVSSIEGFARKVGITVRCAIDPAVPDVFADPDRIVQVLNNLLSNALKFSPRGGEVVLSAVPKAPALVLFRVQDSGPGIPPEFRDKLFTPFAQADRARHEQAGTGLGLAITRALVVKHGGDIWVESELGHGTSFYFTLPTHRTEQP